MTTEWVDVALEEYRTLRQESLEAINRQLQILGLGTTASGVVLGLGVKASAGSATAAVLLVFFSPLLDLLVAILWLGEMERMVRAGRHIATLEQRISAEFPEQPPPLDWEQSLRQHAAARRRLLSVYRSIFGILLLLGLVAAILGNIGLIEHASWLVWVPTSALDLAILLTLTRLFIVTEYRLRAIGGATWTRATLPRIVRIARFGPQLLEICSSGAGAIDADRPKPGLTHSPSSRMTEQ
jgi:hypothetical protein